ncbi:MAG TPA: tetratricopeptide repeat protein, partial [Phycisphaerae bacterium]|nr:tetratricopeptide repeat protein [Phycisphaerae bacterium]
VTVHRRGGLRHIAAAVIPAILIFGAYLAIRYEVGGHRLTVLGQRVAVSNPLRDADGVARWLTPPALLGRYLWLTLDPQRLLCDYSLNVLPPVTTLADGTFWLGLAFLAGCVVLAVRRSPRRPVWWLALLGFATSYFLASNSVMLIDVIFAERLWYSPSIWICLGLAFGLEVGARRIAARGRMAAALAIAAVLILSLRTIVRNPDWRDSPSIVARDLAALTPQHRSAQLCAFLAEYQAQAGALDQAAALLQEAIAIYPDKALYHQSLGRVYLAMHEPRKAADALREALAIEPSRPAPAALLRRAEFAIAGRDLTAEYEAARAAASAQPDNRDALERWAALAESAAPDDAVRAYHRLVTVAPDVPRYWSGLALSQFATGDVEGAAATYAHMVATWPNDWQAHTNLALLLMDRTYRTIYHPAAALRHAQLAVELAPTEWAARVNLAEVTARCGDKAKAAALFDELARQSKPGSTERHLYEDRARYLRE